MPAAEFLEIKRAHRTPCLGLRSTPRFWTFRIQLSLISLIFRPPLPPVVVQERRDSKFRLALGSFLEEFNNRVEIVTVRTPARTRSSTPQARPAAAAARPRREGPSERPPSAAAAAAG